MENSAKLYDIHCPSCGAPAYYDIKSRKYDCRYCGGSVGIDRAVNDRKGFRAIQKKKMNEALKKLDLQKASCTGCGAEVVFENDDAIANCPFCGRSLVRKAYVNADNMPELAIPFMLTLDDAKAALKDWCIKNKRKKEAKEILKQIDDLQGFYLPYELVKGPVDCTASRVENGRVYECGGFVDNVFVNCSNDLDNSLLDGVEPFDLDELKEFDFAYVAGHRVKVGNITGDELEKRIRYEIEDDYEPTVQKVMESKAVYVHVYSPAVVRMPVLLPVYYLNFGSYRAAVNGQTGKVSVRGQKPVYHYIIPWWIKAILSTVAATGIIAAIMLLIGAEKDLVIVAAIALGAFFSIVMLVAYSDNKHDRIRVYDGSKIFTSDPDKKKPSVKPVFFMNLTGRKQPVELKFTSPLRVAQAMAIALLVNFFPAIIALFINGFNFEMLQLGGSAVWLCITVPLTPVILIKYGRIELYDNPWIYTYNDKGKKKRYRKKIEFDFTAKEAALTILKLLFKPPACILVWFCIAAFCCIVYLTAFGFESGY